MDFQEHRLLFCVHCAHETITKKVTLAQALSIVFCFVFEGNHMMTF